MHPDIFKYGWEISNGTMSVEVEWGTEENVQKSRKKRDVSVPKVVAKLLFFENHSNNKCIRVI